MGGYLTDYFELQPADWQYPKWALGMIHTGQCPQPRFVAFEYGGASEIFAWRSDPRVLDE